MELRDDWSRYFAKHYGVYVQVIGEDGEMLVLGHPEPRRVIAAMRKLGRVDYGLDDEDIFWLSTPLTSVAAGLRYTKAKLTPDEDYGFWVTFGEGDEDVVVYGR